MIQMKWKNFIGVSVLGLALTFSLAACGEEDAPSKDNETDQDAATEETEETAAKEVVAGAPLQDGTYSLYETEIGETGWKVVMEMTVEDGEITSSDFNYENEDGELKTEDEEYQETMSEESGTGPQNFIPELNDALVANQNASEVEVVTGATSSSHTFINYAQQLIQAAQSGDTTPIEIENTNELIDGEYSLSEKNIDQTGWKTELTITVEDGKITESDFVYLNEDGELKIDDDEYQEQMADISGTGPQDFIPELNEALVETQDANAVEVVSGATSSSKSFQMYAAQLINAAQKGDTTPIEIDNIVYAEE